MRLATIIFLLTATPSFAGAIGDDLLRKCTPTDGRKIVMYISFGAQKLKEEEKDFKKLGSVTVIDSESSKIYYADLRLSGDYGPTGGSYTLSYGVIEKNFGERTVQQDFFQYDFKNEKIIATNWNWDIIKKDSMKCEIISGGSQDMGKLDSKQNPTVSDTTGNKVIRSVSSTKEKNSNKTDSKTTK